MTPYDDPSAPMGPETPPAMPLQGADPGIPPQGAAEPAGMAPASGQAMTEEDLSTEEEQEAYATAIAAGSKVLYGKGGMDRVLNMFKSANASAEQTSAEIGVMLIREIDDRMDLPETVILPAGLELTMEVVEIAGKSRLLRDDEETQQKVASIATALLFDAYGVTEEDIARDAPELVQAAGSVAGTPPAEAPGLIGQEMGNV